MGRKTDGRSALTCGVFTGPPISTYTARGSETLSSGTQQSHRWRVGGSSSGLTFLILWSRDCFSSFLPSSYADCSSSHDDRRLQSKDFHFPTLPSATLPDSDNFGPTFSAALN